MNPLNPYTLLLQCTFVTVLLLGVYIFKKNPGGRANRTFFIVSLACAIWVFGRSLVFAVDHTDAAESTARLWIAVLWSGAVFIPPAGLHFFAASTAIIPKAKTKFILPLYAVSPVLLFLLVQEDTRLTDYGWDLVYGTPFWGYAVFITTLLGAGAVLLLMRYFKSKVWLEKQEAKYLALGSLIAIVFGSAPDVVLPLFGLSVPPMGGLAILGMTACFAYAILKYGLFTVEAVLETVKAPVEREYLLDAGFSYLIKDSSAQNSLEIFRTMVTETPGLCMTSRFPQKIRSKYKLEKTPIIWFSETTTEEKTVNPWRLEFEALFTISSFIKENEKTVILIDDVGYLVLTNGLQKTLDFLKIVNDTASMYGSTVIGAIDVDDIQESDLPVMETAFEKILDFQSQKIIEEGKSIDIEPSYSYLIEEAKPDKSYQFFKRATSERKGLVITSTMPKKVIKNHELVDVRAYWLSDTTGIENNISPARIDFELTDAIVGFANKNQRAVIMIDGLAHIINATSMDSVLNFLKSIGDMTSVKGASLIVPLDPRLFKGEEHAALQKRFDFVFKPKEA